MRRNYYLPNSCMTCGARDIDYETHECDPAVLDRIERGRMSYNPDTPKGRTESQRLEDGMRLLNADGDDW